MPKSVPPRLAASTRSRVEAKASPAEPGDNVRKSSIRKRSAVAAGVVPGTAATRTDVTSPNRLPKSRWAFDNVM